MRNDNGKNQPSQSGRNARKSGTPGSNTSRGTSTQHTAQERERMLTGLRILAGMIARAHLRRQASDAAEAVPDREARE